MDTDFVVSKPLEGQPWDVAIIGSGPAGLTAAIYTTRGNASTLLIAGDTWGGQLMLTTTVDNFPGFPEGVEGPDLMDRMRKQAERFGTEVVSSKAESLNLSTTPFEITVDGTVHKAKSIIFATGAETRWLGIPGEDTLRGRGVSSCAPCDAPFFKEKIVAVVGGGDSAMEEALTIAKYAREVHLIHRKDSFKASAAMQQKVLNHPKIKVIWKTIVKELKGEQKLEHAVLETEGKGTWELPLDGLFVAIGHIPSTDVVKEVLDVEATGYLKRIEQGSVLTATKIPGVFVAGDVHDNHYRQAITAAGFGAMAALDTLSYLDKAGPSW